VTGPAAWDPTEQDEDEALRLQGIVDAAVLRGDETVPGRSSADDRSGDGDAGADRGRDRCDGCRHYLNPRDALAYCWHPELRILVGASWRCRHHDPAPEEVC
jgi:hypothetical protein